MPSKLLGLMASGKPSIVTGNLKSEVAKIFEESRGGIFLDGKSTTKIIDKITYLKDNPEVASKLGKSAKNYVQKKFSKEKVLSEFLSEIETLLHS